jgi:hypothetical protein
VATLFLSPSLIQRVAPTRVSVCSQLLTRVHHLRIVPPWRWRRYVPPKRRFTRVIHSATSQKTTSFIIYSGCKS